MLRVFVLLAAVACALGARIQPRTPLPDGRIVGGQDALITNHPYQVALRYSGTFFCGGSIIAPFVILTAAHCLQGNITRYSIEYGKTVINLAASTTIIAADRRKVHPSYDTNSNNFDVGLLFLKSAVPFTAAAKSIPLATASPAARTAANVTGWGTTSEGGSISTTLQKATVAIVDHGVCTQRYKKIAATITAEMLCAGVNGGGKDGCQGDSGGPLAAGGKLVGIISWGYGCARARYPGVYTDVAKVRQWIIDNAV